MRFLTIGLIANVLMLVNGCITRDYGMEGEFYFVNKTNYNIVFSPGFEKYNLQPHTVSTVFRTSDLSGKVVEPSSFASPLYKENVPMPPKQTIVIKFDGKRCMVIKDEKGENNPLNINSYTAEKLGERKYKFTYTFTDADYERAVACP